MGIMRITFLAIILGLLSSTNALADTAYFYTVKGVIKGMPGDGLAANEVLVKHQAIPEYRDDTGAITGMMAMTMPFYLSEGVSLSGFKTGDAVELKIEQHLSPKFSELVIAVKKGE
jgi:Cu/Ag efflux protein CusF